MIWGGGEGVRLVGLSWVCAVRGSDVEFGFNGFGERGSIIWGWKVGGLVGGYEFWCGVGFPSDVWGEWGTPQFSCGMGFPP